MRSLHLLKAVPLMAVTILLSACGGGGGSAGDTVPKAAAPDVAITGPNSFLLFPNPQLQADGTLQTNTAAYTEAYYRAIDPTNARDTLDKYKATNGFGSGTGTEITVVFGDQKDLGYGRRMNVRRNADGTLAFYVENYLIKNNGQYAYSNLNLDAAVARDTRWLVGVNAIEYSPGPNGGLPFPKFYNFKAETLQRATFVDLDGRGEKAMPGPCISCHGGRGDALTPPDASGNARFNLVQNGASQVRGDVQAHLHGFEMDSFGFSNVPGFTRAELEGPVKTINKWILCSYPLEKPSTAAEDQCRRTARTSEWQGTLAAEAIKSAYGGDGMPSATYADNYVPEGWLTAGQSSLYRDVIAKHCRACHELRGTGLQSDLDFGTYAKFQAYSDRVKAHIQDRGNMPLAKIVSESFYASQAPESIASFLQGLGVTARDTAGAALRPGRPLADAGPSRVVKQGATPLSAARSLYASTYQWSIVSGPAGGATLSNSSGAQITFNASQNGTYVVQLVTGNGSLSSVPSLITIVVDNTLSPAPSAIRFADIKAVLQGGAGCTNAGCHSVGGGVVESAPLMYTDTDRNGDGIVGDATDDQWYYAEVRSRINFTDIAASPLLRKPSNNHHKGLLRPGFDASLAPGSTGRANYDIFLNWILNGAPQ